MEATSVDVIPAGPEWQYEPKWDGFRCLVFRGGDKVELQSKSGKPLTRYFPDVVEARKRFQAKQFVLDGEIVVPRGRAFSFDDLLQRIHPAASRIAKLAQETPALFIVFDLLEDERGNALLDTPLAARRPKLEAFASKNFRGDGVMTVAGDDQARRGEGLAEKGWRDARRHHREATRCALRGRHARRDDEDQELSQCGLRGRWLSLRHQQQASSGRCCLGSMTTRDCCIMSASRHRSRAPRSRRSPPSLKSSKAAPGFTGNAPGGPSRWSTERSAEWVPLKPKLVVEVCYDHFSGERFRHGTRVVRWRPDKAPGQCTMDQVKQKKADLMRLLK